MYYRYERIFKRISQILENKTKKFSSLLPSLCVLFVCLLHFVGIYHYLMLTSDTFIDVCHTCLRFHLLHLNLRRSPSPSGPSYRFFLFRFFLQLVAICQSLTLVILRFTLDSSYFPQQIGFLCNFVYTCKLPCTRSQRL